MGFLPYPTPHLGGSVTAVWCQCSRSDFPALAVLTRLSTGRHMELAHASHCGWLVGASIVHEPIAEWQYRCARKRHGFAVDRRHNVGVVTRKIVVRRACWLHSGIKFTPTRNYNGVSSSLQLPLSQQRLCGELRIQCLSVVVVFVVVVYVGFGCPCWLGEKNCSV